MTGSTIPGFELGELLGRGGCASVYRARQVSVGRDVALKIDNRHVTTERDRRRFLREVTSVGRLSGHPHVVEIYDAGVLADDRPWIAMQLCPAGSLHDHVRDHGPLSSAELQRVGVQLADALATAHEAGIVHRDVKPGNVLVNSYGVVVLSDFGLASVLDADSRQTATRGVFTPAYAAPEALGLDDPAPAMDLWSFACTVFELATGRLPAFRGRGAPIGPDDVVAAALAEPFEPVALPPALVDWLVRGLAFDPAGRWPSAAHMRDELAALDLTQVPELPAPADRPARPRLLLERLPSGPGTPGAPPPGPPPSQDEPTQASPEARPALPAVPARGPADLPAQSSPEVVAQVSPGGRRHRAPGSGPRSQPTRRTAVVALVALGTAAVVGVTWGAGRSQGRDGDARTPAAGAGAAATPVAAAAGAAGSSPSVTPVPLDDTGSWLLDIDRVHAALDRVEAAAKHELRFTSLIAVRVNGFSQLAVDTQDPAHRESVLQYFVDGAGRVTGPKEVTSLPMRDVGASVVTAAMVDAKTFDRSALPGRAAFAEGQRAALERANLRKGEVRYWSVNAYWGGRPRMMLSIESPIAKAVVEIDRQGKVLQVTPA